MKVVSNSSPLIFLSAIGMLDLLKNALQKNGFWMAADLYNRMLED